LILDQVLEVCHSSYGTANISHRIDEGRRLAAFEIGMVSLYFRISALKAGGLRPARRLPFCQPTKRKQKVASPAEGISFASLVVVN